MAKTTEETLAEEDAARAVVAAFQALDRINARDYNKLWKPTGMDRLHSCLLELQRPGWMRGISVVDDRSAQEIHFLKWQARRSLAFAFQDLEKVVNLNDFKKLWEANVEMQELYKTLRKLEHRVFPMPLLQLPLERRNPDLRSRQRCLLPGDELGQIDRYGAGLIQR